MSYHYISGEDAETMYKSEENFLSTIKRVLDGDDYDNGQVEAAREQADAVSTMMGRLLLMLVETNTLTKEQIEFVIDPSFNGYHNKEYRWPSSSPVKEFKPKIKTSEK